MAQGSTETVCRLFVIRTLLIDNNTLWTSTGAGYISPPASGYRSSWLRGQPDRHGTEDFLDDETFPGGPAFGVGQQGILAADAKQAVQNAAIGKIDLRRFDLALAGVGMPGA